jgi:coenzyme F420-0:L-glutamate ligase / coenzyme F420-1:gamma-L-glutamate ligase
VSHSDSTVSQPVTILSLTGIPLIQPGDDLPKIILEALDRMQCPLMIGDVLVVTSKIVSKAEGRFASLRDVTPGDDAIALAEETEKDPRLVELVLHESQQISRKGHRVLVTQHRLGFVSANAGIDQSNVDGSDEHVLLLPVDPDRSAAIIRDAIHSATGVEVGIVISDTHGRPFRMGNVGVAVGVAGIPALLDLRGEKDLFGRVLRVTTQGYADLVASAAHLVCGEGDEGLPVTLVRGLRYPAVMGTAAELNRPPELDLYR